MRSLASAIVASSSTILLIGCGWPPGEHADGGADANPPDAAEPWEHRSITLASGLVVDAWGPASELSQLSESPLASEFCERFELSVVLTFDSLQVPVAYAAAGALRAAPRVCTSSDFRCAPHNYFTEHLLPNLGAYEVPNPGDQPIGAGFVSHPLGISFYPIEYRESGTPFITGLFDTRNSAPVAAFVHEGGNVYYMPNEWQDAQGARAYSGSPTWSRAIDFPFWECMQAESFVPQAMRLYFTEDLATCGVIFALPFPLNAPDIAFEDLVWCPTSPAGYGVALLSTVQEHPFIVTECPRPIDAEYEWLCFTQ